MALKKHKLHLVREAEADGRTLTIFEEIKQALGIPYVNMMFQAFASFPEFFELFWQTLKPVLATREFFAFSERIGAEGYTGRTTTLPYLICARGWRPCSSVRERKTKSS